MWSFPLFTAAVCLRLHCWIKSNACLFHPPTFLSQRSYEADLESHRNEWRFAHQGFYRHGAGSQIAATLKQVDDVCNYLNEV